MRKVKLTLFILAVVIVAALLISNSVRKANEEAQNKAEQFSQAVSLLDEYLHFDIRPVGTSLQTSKLDEAINILKLLKDYKDSAEHLSG